MTAEIEGRRRTFAFIWWLGAVISAATLCVQPYRHDGLDLSRRSPFDNTASEHAEQWVFLREAEGFVPPGTSFTVTARDRDTEMSLYMMSVGLLPDARPLPSSYYAVPVDAGDHARFVLEFCDDWSISPGEALVTHPPGGRVVERRAHPP